MVTTGVGYDPSMPPATTLSLHNSPAQWIQEHSQPLDAWLQRHVSDPSDKTHLRPGMVMNPRTIRARQRLMARMALARLRRHPERDVTRSLSSAMGILISLLNLLRHTRDDYGVQSTTGERPTYRALLSTSTDREGIRNLLARMLTVWIRQSGLSPSSQRLRGTSIIHRSPFIRTVLSILRTAIREGVFRRCRPADVAFSAGIPSLWAAMDIGILNDDNRQPLRSTMEPPSGPIQNTNPGAASPACIPRRSPTRWITEEMVQRLRALGPPAASPCDRKRGWFFLLSFKTVPHLSSWRFCIQLGYAFQPSLD